MRDPGLVAVPSSELVAAALLGTARRPVPPTTRGASEAALADPARLLLDLAAMNRVTGLLAPIPTDAASAEGVGSRHGTVPGRDAATGSATGPAAAAQPPGATGADPRQLLAEPVCPPRARCGSRALDAAGSGRRPQSRREPETPWSGPRSAGALVPPAKSRVGEACRGGPHDADRPGAPERDARCLVRGAGRHCDDLACPGRPGQFGQPPRGGSLRDAGTAGGVRTAPHRRERGAGRSSDRCAGTRRVRCAVRHRAGNVLQTGDRDRLRLDPPPRADLVSDRRELAQQPPGGSA